MPILATSVAGSFWNNGSGTLLEGLSGVNSTKVFSVDGSGNVNGTSFTGNGSGLTNISAGSAIYRRYLPPNCRLALGGQPSGNYARLDVANLFQRQSNHHRNSPRHRSRRFYLRRRLRYSPRWRFSTGLGRRTLGGHDTATTGAHLGTVGIVDSPGNQSAGVLGRSTSTTGIVSGVIGNNVSPAGSGRSRSDKSYDYESCDD